MDQFAWTRQQAVLNNSIIGGVNALLMIIYYITIAYISKWYAVGGVYTLIRTILFLQGGV